MLRKNVFPVSCFVISFLTLIITLSVTNNTSLYSNLYILPLSFMIMCIAFWKLFSYTINNLIYIIVIGGYFCRNVVAIFFLGISDFSSYIEVKSAYSINHAIFLMVFETLCVFLYLNYIRKKDVYISENDKKFVLPEKLASYYILAFVLIIIFMLSMWYYEPTIQKNYVSLFSSGASIFSSKAINAEVSHGTLSRIVLTLFLFMFAIIRVIVPIFVLGFIKRRIKGNFIRVLLSLLVISLQLFFTTSETMETVMIILIQFLVLTKLYSDKRVNLIYLMIVVVAALFIYIVNGKTISSAPKIDNISNLLQAYFPGVTNMAGIFNIDKYDKANCILSDFYTMIPFRKTLFSEFSELKTVEVFTKANRIPGHIIPFMGEMYLYVSYFAPIIIVLQVAIANKFYNIARKTDGLLQYTVYMYTACYFAMSVSMYHITIIGATFLSTCLPMIIICRILKNQRKAHI